MTSKELETVKRFSVTFGRLWQSEIARQLGIAEQTVKVVFRHLFAKFAIVHLDRVWLFNIKIGSTLFPDMILACKFEDPTNWDSSTRGGPTTVGGGSFSTGLEAFFLKVPDLKPINGVTIFQNTIVFSTTNGRTVGSINATNWWNTVVPTCLPDTAVTIRCCRRSHSGASCPRRSGKVMVPRIL